MPGGEAWLGAPAEFDCVQCNIHVTAFGIAAPPAHRRCSVCAWGFEHIADQAERAAFLARAQSIGE